MTYIIAEPCIDIKDRSCVDVCPVDCIHEFERILITDPEELHRLEGAQKAYIPRNCGSIGEEAATNAIKSLIARLRAALKPRR